MAGLAGVGKTALAEAGAHGPGNRAGSAAVCCSATCTAMTRRQWSRGKRWMRLLRALGVAAEHIPPTAEERTGLYRLVLAADLRPGVGNRRRRLLRDASPAASARHRAAQGTGHLQTHPGRAPVPGKSTSTILDEDGSVELLETALPTARPDDDRISGDPEAAGRLARVCGGLPLALQITAALLKADPGPQRQRPGR